MKIHEIISETKLKKGKANPLPHPTSFPNFSQDPYQFYRFGVALAGSPESPSIDSTFNGTAITVAYSDAEVDMINKAAKAVGAHDKITHSNTGSKEHPNVNKSSPVAKIKKNKYGI